MDEMLRVVCPHCGRAFASAEQVSRSRWHSTQWDLRSERCLLCGERSLMQRSEYFYA